MSKLMGKKLLEDETGFTLIELMVVVAIIGVLSAIAVPNFKKYQAKAKQSEAKIQLAAVYTTEVGSMADYDSYATCLVDLGYEQPARGYYLLGFNAVVVGNVAARTTCTSSEKVAPGIPLKAGGTAPVSISNTGSKVDSDGQTFTAEAAGNIESTNIDHWTITEAKTITQLQNKRLSIHFSPEIKGLKNKPDKCENGIEILIVMSSLG